MPQLQKFQPTGGSQDDAGYQTGSHSIEEKKNHQTPEDHVENTA